MAVAYDLNRTLEASAPEAKAVHHPPGYREGAFPRETLGRNETIYWEGKPSLASYLLAPIMATIVVALIILYVLARLLEVFPEADLSLFFSNREFWLYVVLPLAAYYVVQLIKWYRTSFAITDLRVLTKYGVFTTSFCDCRHDKIQNTVVVERLWQWICGYGTVLYATGGHSGGIMVGASAKMRNGGGIYWVGVPHPYEIKRYCEDIINYSINKTKRTDAERLALAINGGGLGRPTASGDLGSGGAVSLQEQGLNRQAPLSFEEKIASLNRLKDNGVISWDDYERMRKKIVGAD